MGCERLVGSPKRVYSQNYQSVSLRGKQMAFCANCGSDKGDGAFCGKCGSGSATSATATPTHAAPAPGTVPTGVTLALVFAFLIPMVGLILAIVNKKEAESIGGLAASRNKLALTLSIVFMAISAIAWVALVAMSAAMSTSYMY
jgi:ribosomal protein S27AE